MKHYVLDEPLAAAPLPPAGSPAPSLTQPGWWRWLVLAIVLEAVALAVLYVALNGVPGAGSVEPSRGIAYVASFSFPRELDSAGSPAPPREAPVSRVRQERGRYLVDLHDETPAAAMEMLAQATKAHVAGSTVFSGSALRLTRSVVATTPREAWQAVFGDVANFVIACAGSACDVRFVSLVKPGASGPASIQGEPSHSEPAPVLAPPAPVGQAAAVPPPLLNGDGAPLDN